MPRPPLILLICLISTSCLFARNPENKKINWGFKVGFNSAIPSTDVKSESGPLTTKSMNKVGYLAEIFLRANKQRLFFQPELAYSITQENIYIQTPDNSNYATLDIKVNAVDLSGIIGYNIVKQNQYCLNVFAGCKYKYAYRIDTEPGKAANYTDTDSFYNLYIVTGVGVNISRLFFDFRYDFALMENEEDMTKPMQGDYGEIIVNRKSNILSFSIGMMF